MGREYDSARMALANIDSKREIPVISKSSTAYSGFHLGRIGMHLEGTAAILLGLG